MFFSFLFLHMWNIFFFIFRLSHSIKTLSRKNNYDLQTDTHYLACIKKILTTLADTASHKMVTGDVTGRGFSTQTLGYYLFYG